MALFGIKRIQYCKATQLAFSGQNNPFLGIASEPTNTFTDIVCMINSRATLTIEQAVVNKQIVYTAKLQFVTPADPMLDVDHYAFIATTNEGERILLGANTRPQVAVVTAQGVFGNAGELTAYTTTAEFKADYRPLRLPVNSEAIEDLRVFDICCGQITGTETPDTLTVVWQNYDGTELDRKTYYSNQPEPTTTVVPTKPSTAQYSYTFSSWELYSNQDNTKIYRPIFTQTAVIYTVRWINYDNTTVAEENYTYGQPEPTTSVVPTKPSDGQYSYTFNSWELFAQSATLKVYRATYTQTAIVETFTVIWLDGDGSVLEEATYQTGQSEPTCSQTPTKAEDDSYTYTFNSWQLLTDINNVKTYEPTFTATPIDPWEVKNSAVLNDAYIKVTVNGSGTIKVNGRRKVAVGEQEYDNITIWNGTNTGVRMNDLVRPKYGIIMDIPYDGINIVYVEGGSADIGSLQVFNARTSNPNYRTGYYYKVDTGTGLPEKVGYYLNYDTAAITAMENTYGVGAIDI